MKRIIHKVKFVNAFVLMAAMMTGLMASAQDTHFSQFYSTPLFVNPAMTGIFDGKVRLSNDYRAQWGSIADAYKTIHVSLDAPLGKSRFNKNYFGVGLLVYQDNAGSAKFTHTIIEGSLAYTMPLDDGDNFISIGFRGGMDSRAIDLSKATWSSQWNGDNFDANLPGESFLYQQRTYFDFTSGIMWYYIPDGVNSISAGGSYSHILTPDLSFYGVYHDYLNTRITAHAGAEISLTPYNTFWIVPKVLTQFQGNQSEIMIGTFFKSKLQFKSKYTNYQKDVFVSFGGWYRVGDAIVIATRFDYHEFGLGVSYDMNTSQLGSLTSSSGGPEITLSYVSSVKRGQRSRHFNKMPKFF